MRFDGVNFPILQVSIAMAGGATLQDPNSGVFTLDVSQLDTGQVGGSLAWVDIAADVDSLNYFRGSQGELEDASPGTLTVVIDNTSGNYDPRNSSGLYFGNLDIGLPIWVRAIWQGVTYDRFRGFIDAIDTDAGNTPIVTLTCYDALEVLGRAVFHTAYPAGDLAGTRVSEILDGAQWPTSLRSIETGSYQMQATSITDAASSALVQLNNVVDSELGLLAADGSGNVVFFGRLHVYTSTRSQNWQAFFDDQNTGDVDEDALVLTRGSDLLFNEARITRNGGTEQVYDDPGGSILKYGLRTFGGNQTSIGGSGGVNAGVMLNSDTDAYTLASWIVGRFRQPADRIKTLKVDMAPLADQWATVLPLTYMDKIQAVRKYSSAAQQIVISGVILGIGEDITQDSWVFTFSTRNLDNFQPFILDTSKLNTGTVA